MYKRKKSHGGLKVLLLLLFITLSGMYSTSYAVVSGQMNSNRAKYIFDYIYKETISDYPTMSMNWGVYTSNPSENASSWSYTTKQSMAVNNGNYNETNINQFTQVFNQADNSINGGLGVEHYIFIPCYSNDGTTYIYCFPNNNGIGNELPHIRLFFTYYSSNAFTLKVDYDSSLGNYGAFLIMVKYSGVTASSTKYSNAPYYFLNRKSTNINVFEKWNNSSTTYYTKFNIVSLRNQSFYSNSNNLNIASFDSLNTFSPYILKTFYEEEEPEPTVMPTVVPTTPIPTPSGGGGIDYTNQLNNINNSINTQGQNIQNAINNQGQAIANAIDNANENYWGSEEELTGEEQEEQIEENINDLMENISGELTNSEIMQQLERSRSGLFRFL